MNFIGDLIQDLHFCTLYFMSQVVLYVSLKDHVVKVVNLRLSFCSMPAG